MRLLDQRGRTVHLAYCTNVHPAEDLDGVLNQLRRFARPVRRHLGVDRLGLGLWLAHRAAATLAADPRAVDRLRTALDRHGLEVVTLNGFPYRGFHTARVKHAVYRPDWSRPERLTYTLDLAAVLARLMPDDAARGSVSTLPFAWRTPWSRRQHTAALANLHRLTEGLSQIAAVSGRPVRVGIEPEPGCVVETTDQAVALLTGVDTRWLGVCLDACHLAVAAEDPQAAAARLAAAGLPVVKLQASAALHADRPGDPATRAALAAFAEDRFLHQTRESADGRTGDGEARRCDGWDDLPDALAGSRPPSARGPWRVHFHLPLHARPRPPLRATSTELLSCLDALFGDRTLTDHVEVETYTWGVLPAAARPDGDAGLAVGIAGELAWVRDALVARGLTVPAG
ncbi:metabolite traffic protein EboE [Actinoallomurus spadix]|uniref:Metabolite traffic protein EboE n=1 Tax=Actinoallomurus spadix TaxID=79912 RepID=A0ABN0W748_9ACTN|nr:metabolite traffic protein EboE [Actinoallomurus spadix]MCO5986345.1 metabolite traffic protein EboE [Actinoallomurus spadix]